jgi:1,4-dihydroxy-2-naphthoyl-CoA synthase
VFFLDFYLYRTNQDLDYVRDIDSRLSKPTISQNSVHPVIQVSGVRKAYGSTFAVDDVSFEVNQAALYDGTMYSAEMALHLGMIDQVSSQEKLLQDSREVAKRMGGKDAAAFSSIKGLLRAPVAQELVKEEDATVQELVRSGIPRIPGRIFTQ